MAIVLAIAAVVIDQTLKCLASFESHTDLNQEFVSKIIKGSFLKFINSGVVIIFINYRYHFIGGVEIGSYDDVTPTWFINIGYSIVLTFIFKILSLLFWTLYRFLVPCCSRCYDRSCTCNKKTTRKDTLREYLSLYTGTIFDIDYSYSEIIKTVLICLLFGSILPVMYIIGVVHLTILYWRDKILSKNTLV